jgi:hypothetical protein
MKSLSQLSVQLQNTVIINDTYLHVFSLLDMIKAILEMTVKLLCHSWSFAHLGKKSSFGALVAFDVTHGFLQPFPHIVPFKLSKKH